MTETNFFERIDKLEKWAKEKLAELDQFKEALSLYCDGQDANTTQLRRNIGVNPFKARTLEQKVKEPQKQVDAKDMARLPFDASKISWQPKEREDKSKWELASDRDNQSNSDYRALRQFLSQEKKTVSEGQFYWLMDTAVGRQLNKKGKP